MSTEEKIEKEVLCPTCKKKVKFSKENPFRPFCSERCHLLDLGAWADENYKIPTNETDSLPVNENSESKNEIQ